MLRKSKHKVVLVANLDGEQIVFLVRKKYLTALEGYIEDMTKEYENEAPPQKLKDYIIECIIHLEGEWVEILGGLNKIVMYSEV